MSPGVTNARTIMPKPSLPPTPAASLDITGKQSANAPHLETGFILPPAALPGSRGSIASSSGPSDAASDSSYRPISPSSPVASSKPGHARKRSSTAAQQSVVTKDDYSLPPPPTRSRKIIQMKPKDAQEHSKPQAQASHAKTTATAATSTTNGTKRKQAGSTSAAGRKIARKTAHSLIERRRRSKMNEEFGVLKDMIPACRGQEMHKLAILQASIEYMRYLEQCIADLKNAHQSRRDSPSSAVSETAPPPFKHNRDEDDEDDEDEEDDDEEMEDATSPTQVESAAQASRFQFADTSPAIQPSDRSVYSHTTTTSPAIMPHDYGRYSANPSPALRPSDPHHYSLTSSSIRSTLTSPSIHPSPAFSAHTPSATHFSNPFRNGPPSTGPVAASGSSHSAVPFSLTSPALGPVADREDAEATEALLMLNTDRRSWSGARGMSVKDLLSG